MIWQLFALFLSVSFVLIYIGLMKPDETASALIGFVFLFLLSFVVLGNNLEYKSAENIIYVYGDNYDGYHYDDYNGTLMHGDLNLFHENRTYTYSVYDDTTGIFNTTRFGYFLAIASIVGFVGCLISLRGGWKE